MERDRVRSRFFENDVAPESGGLHWIEFLSAHQTAAGDPEHASDLFLKGYMAATDAYSPACPMFLKPTTLATN